MSRFVGFLCRQCGRFLKVGEQFIPPPGIPIRYLSPQLPVKCRCGFSSTYITGDLVDEDKVPLPQ